MLGSGNLFGKYPFNKYRHCKRVTDDFLHWLISTATSIGYDMGTLNPAPLKEPKQTERYNDGQLSKIAAQFLTLLE